MCHRWTNRLRKLHLSNVCGTLSMVGCSVHPTLSNSPGSRLMNESLLHFTRFAVLDLLVRFW